MLLLQLKTQPYDTRHTYGTINSDGRRSWSGGKFKRNHIFGFVNLILNLKTAIELPFIGCFRVGCHFLYIKY